MTDIIPSSLIFYGYTATQVHMNSGTEVRTIGTIADGANAMLKFFIAPKICAAGTNVTNVTTETQNEYNPNALVSANVTVHVIPFTTLISPTQVNNQTQSNSQTNNQTQTANPTNVNVPANVNFNPITNNVSSTTTVNGNP